MKSNFQEAYLRTINVIKEDIDNLEMQAPEGVEDNNAGVKKVSFSTTDQALLDVLNSDFNEVTFFVTSKNEMTGEDEVTEVKIGKDSFSDIDVVDLDVDNEVEECGDSEVATEEGEEGKEGEEEDDEVATEEDEVATEEDEVATEDDEVATEEDEVATEEDEVATEEGEDVAVECSEWLEDGVCVKCQDPECDGSCKCKKCGDVNCIGDC